MTSVPGNGQGVPGVWYILSPKPAVNLTSTYTYDYGLCPNVTSKVPQFSIDKISFILLYDTKSNYIFTTLNKMVM